MSDIHVSLDLETLSTRPDAAIISIGAAARVEGNLETFVCYVRTEDQFERHVDEQTLAWWEKKPDLWGETMERCCDHGLSLAPHALDSLQQWLTYLGTDQDRIYVWGNGANFDVAILEHAYKSAGRQPPWAYWATRDLRTIKWLAEETGQYRAPTRAGTHHDVRDDAVFQLEVIEHSLSALAAGKK